MAATPPGSCKSKQGENEADGCRVASRYSALLNCSARGGFKFVLPYWGAAGTWKTQQVQLSEKLILVPEPLNSHLTPSGHRQADGVKDDFKDAKKGKKTSC